MRKLTTFFLISIFLLACNRPNAEPEKLDPIFSDLEKEISSTDSEIKKTEKDLEGFEKDLRAVVPQTGQIKYAEKRVSETRAKLDKLIQMKKYWEMRLQSRKKWDREEYLKAFNKKTQWPDPKEYDEYQIQRKLELAPKNWDAKQRVEDSKLQLMGKSEKQGHGEGSEGKSEPKEHH